MDWENDENSQLDVQKGKKVAVPLTSKKWKHTQKGVTFNLDGLIAFLDNDWANLLLATCLDEAVQKEVQDLAMYMADEKPVSVIPLLEKLKQPQSNRDMALYLEEVVQEFLTTRRAINMNKLGKELNLFFSQLLLNSADNWEVLDFDLKKEKRKPKMSHDEAPTAKKAKK